MKRILTTVGTVVIAVSVWLAACSGEHSSTTGGGAETTVRADVSADPSQTGTAVSSGASTPDMGLRSSGTATLSEGTTFEEGYGVAVETAGIIDQQQPEIDLTVGGLAVGWNSEQILAQVVTAGVSGFLSEVRFPIACTYGDLIIEVEGVDAETPDGTVWTYQSFPSEGLPGFYPSSPEFRSFGFSEPACITAGARFAVILRSTGGCALFQGPVGNPYPGGDAYFDSRPNEPGVWVSTSIGDNRHDLPFKTVVTPSFACGSGPTDSGPTAESDLVVGIDIKPGSSENSINPGSSGKIPVAILSTADFDAPARIDTASLTFGHTGGEPSLAFCNAGPEDVNGDGFPDLVCHFFTQLAGFQSGDSEGILKGRTMDGAPFTAKDSVRIVP